MPSFFTVHNNNYKVVSTEEASMIYFILKYSTRTYVLRINGVAFPTQEKQLKQTPLWHLLENC